MKQIPLNTDVDGNCSCLKANYYKMGGANFIGHSKDGFKATCVMEKNITETIRIPQATEQGYVEVPQGAVFDGSYPNSKTRRGRLQDGGQTSPTLMASGESPCYYEGVKESTYRIRKLTEREAFRLMGVSESDIDKIQASGVSRSQQYKMAGNSIVVDVLEHIFRKLFIDTGQESQQLSLF